MFIKVVIHVEMPKAATKKSICHFQKLQMILKWNKQNTVRLPQKYQFVFSRIKLHAPTKVILEFYKSNINSLSKKDKSILV